MSYPGRIAAPFAALLVATTFVVISSYAGARERQYHAYGLSHGRSTKGDKRAAPRCGGARVRIENRSGLWVGVTIYYKKKTTWDKTNNDYKKKVPRRNTASWKWGNRVRTFRIRPGQQWAPENFIMTQNISSVGIRVSGKQRTGLHFSADTRIMPKATTPRGQTSCSLHWVYPPRRQLCNSAVCYQGLLLLNKEGGGSITVIPRPTR